MPDKDQKDLTYCRVYKTNTAVYQTAEYVDMMCSGLVVLSTYKVARQLHILATLGQADPAFSMLSLGLWSIVGSFQMRYLA